MALLLGTYFIIFRLRFLSIIDCVIVCTCITCMYACAACYIYMYVYTHTHTYMYIHIIAQYVFSYCIAAANKSTTHVARMRTYAHTQHAQAATLDTVWCTCPGMCILQYAMSI